MNFNNFTLFDYFVYKTNVSPLIYEDYFEEKHQKLKNMVIYLKIKIYLLIIKMC